MGQEGREQVSGVHTLSCDFLQDHQAGRGQAVPFWGWLQVVSFCLHRHIIKAGTSSGKHPTLGNCNLRGRQAVTTPINTLVN